MQDEGPTVRTTVRLVNKQGLHARPISQFVAAVMGGRARVRVTGPDGTVADGGSAFSMMTLAAGQGSELQIEAAGPDAALVLDRLTELVMGGFGEE